MAGGDVAKGGDGDDTFVVDVANFDGSTNTITGGEGGEFFGDTLSSENYTGDVTQDQSNMVTYVHMLFDQHEVIYAEGAATESFHPGDIGFSTVVDTARESTGQLRAAA